MQKLTGQYKNQRDDLMNLHAGDAKCAAFFDVDRTLIKGDSQELEARFIIKNHKPALAYFLSMLFTMGGLQLNRLGWISLIRQNEIYLRSYRGKTRQELESIGTDLFNQVISREFLNGALEILEKHRCREDLIVLVSATTRHLLSPFDAVLKPDHIFCTNLEFDGSGRCAGKAVGGICGQEKKQAVVRAFARENNIDLLSSHAYSDHHSDIPFLASVGYPAAINPTKKLENHAKKMGWPIHRFE